MGGVVIGAFEERGVMLVGGVLFFGGLVAMFTGVTTWWVRMLVK